MAGSSERRMRILFVEASSGGVVGGSLTGLYHGILGLARRGHELGIVLYEKKPIEADFQRLQVSVWHNRKRRLPKDLSPEFLRSERNNGAFPALWASRMAVRRTLSTFVEDLPATLRLLPLLRQFRPDVVHAGNGVRANFDVLLGCVFARIPVVCHVKGFEKYTARERWITPRLAGLVCMTQAVLEYCRTHGIAHPHSAVIYDAIDEKDFRPTRNREQVRRDWGVEVDAPLVGVVGNVQEWKGQAVFVEAFAKLASDFPALRGMLIGGVHRAGHEYFEKIKEHLRREELESRIVVTGLRSDVPDLVNALDVLVHTSVRPEPFGRVILEGMLLGKPVVATEGGGVPELIAHGRTGFLVPPGDAPALAACLAHLLRDSQKRASMGLAAREWARERFSLDRHVAELEHFYVEAIDRKRRP